ncbi:nitroreductase family protein [Clostridium formicaceticum]|uniref:NAD(P)H nitroreductase YodC n=1 Tax=Clostridium formicaceticum TaxID=1497 RepID=A0AAC9RNF8_9CLOT|nr:nitroreductase [Clostridium formicaceticum]AOY77803.1 nitroreductase family protein [Clostridium formicaceticum]ARE88413.1 Putative NAD(P)H nitroreductase YodC [Clostridium formicaceticum]
MNILDCINEKRSVRAYTDQQVSNETIHQLLTLGTKASTGSNEQPWGFVVIQGKEEIQKLSEDTKTYLLRNLDAYPYLKQYESWLLNPTYSVFNHASTLIAIYGNTKSHWYLYDCSLAAGNIMLAAHSMGIGTCWIGFAEHTLNTKEFKEKYRVPSEYELVCPMTIGYMKSKLTSPERKVPEVFNW